MAKILVGTSGYSYKDWIGPFYPQGTPEKDFLAFFAARFSFVELNFSYYTMPAAPLLEKLIEKTGPDFQFAIKTHQSLTHEKSDALDKDIEIYRRGIRPLVDGKKLGAVLIQFPFSFHYTTDNRRHLDRLCRGLEGLPLAVEFRNREWVLEPVLVELKKRNAAFVNVDQPDLPNLILPSAHVTADIAYVRFHGRNRENWWTGDNVSRYDYQYNDDELAGWLNRIRELSGKVRLLFVAFNNHSRGQALVNAGRLKAMLVAEGTGAL
jgi:uncharacterized protein YecE (DUF72 family)